MSPNRFLNTIYSFIVKDLTPESKAEVEERLEAPLPGHKFTVDPNAELEQFMQATAGL